MKIVTIFALLLLLGLVCMVVDIKTTPPQKETLENFAKLSQLYTLQIEKNNFIYKKSNE